MYDRPFRWWVQSVMPLVFDDSLSYYEVLAKLTKYIEGLTGDVDQIEKILETIEGIEDIAQFTEFLETIQSEIGDLANLSTQTKTNLVSAINEVALKADIAYWKPASGIPESDLSQEVQDKLNKTGEATKYIINNKELKAAPSNNSPSELGLGTYTVPSGGIPWDTLSQDVQDRINAGGGGGTGGTTDYNDLNNKPQINGHTLNAGNNASESLGLGTYSKPSEGIPESDLSAEVQEKLNTSGGIADNQESFTASRDYEAGELVYINGTLYKTKYKILAGTTMIPGNNIETTDISAELERINSDIEALQSGSGPDSWTLAADADMSQTSVQYRIFEYINAIGGETYTIIFTPINPSDSNNAYTAFVYKRDGTRDYSFGTINNFNQRRFTWTPEDTGEYYFIVTASYPNIKTRVEIEYSASQGISELWSKVNEAAKLEPRVSAVETLAAQQQTQLENLVGVPERVSILESDVSDIRNDVKAFTGNAEIEFIKNAYIVTSGADVDVEAPVASSTGYKYAVINCTEGDKFTVTSSGGQNPRAWCFIDVNGHSLLVEAANTSCNNKVITAPYGATKLVINAKNDEISYLGEFLVTRFNNLSEYYTYNKSWLTDLLLPNEDINLDLLFNASTTNKRSIKLTKNIIKTVPIASSPSGSTYANFLISKKARYLDGSANPQNKLGEDDFTAINIYSGQSLTLKMKIKTKRLLETDRRSGNIIIATYKKVIVDDSEQMDIAYTSVGNFITKYNEDYYITRAYDLVSLLPEIAENKNIAIIYSSRYASVAEDILLEFDMPKRIDDSTTVKEIGNAILNCLQHVTWIDADGQTYYNALNALING